MIKLRDYQQEGKDLLYRNIQSGISNNLFWCQTGSGKSVVESSIIADAIASGGHAVLAVRRRELIKQMSGHMDKWGISHGVYMAGHHRYRPSERVQICSIDTLASRDIAPHSDKKNTLVIVDECHDCTPRSSKYVKFMESYSGPKIGFTATPFSDNSMWNAIVKPIEAHELRDLGYLVPDRTFVPNIIDVSGVRINRGEFNEQELFEASSTSEIVGDFIRDWQLYAQGRPTVLFAINVDHSKLIAEAFNSAGIKAVHADATTPSRERDSILKKLASGAISVLTNVNIFSTGVDVPEIAAIQLCRPTQSLIWFLQAIGRGLRPSPSTGKQNCIIIDNAGNTLRHGTAYRVREAELGRQRRQVVEMDEESVSIKRCQRCNYVYEPKEKECLNCGFVNPAQERRINQRDGDLVEYQMSEEEKAALVKKSFVSDYHKIKFVANTKLKRNNKTQWIRERLEEKYGFTVCKQYGEIINLEF